MNVNHYSLNVYSLDGPDKTAGGPGHGGTAAACSGAHLPAFVDGNKEARTKSRSSLRAASV